MKCPLAIISPDIGMRSESFIRRHMCDLVPGGTAVVARASHTNGVPVDWTVPGPVLDLSTIVGGRLRWQAAHGLARQFGVKLDKVMLGRFLREHQVRVVLGEYLDFSLQWFETIRDLGLTFFAHGHGHDVSGRLQDPAWRSGYLRYHEAGGIITINRPSQEELLRLGLEPSKIHLIPYGVEVPAAPPDRQERAEILCVAVGRMVAHKSPILLLDAFRRAAERCPRLRLEYLGSGPLLPAARDFVRAFQLEGQVSLPGGRPNVAVLQAMQRADIFLQHSITDAETGDQEGVPVAILEAMANALPVVSTRHAGIPEAVVDGATGLLAEPGDSAGMAEHIRTLAGRRSLRLRMGRAGWEHARDHFTWEREKAALLEVLGLPSE
jgi:glycosyltransferase involved in cell wall biosynthesis